jgi:hypothetical protein
MKRTSKNNNPTPPSGVGHDCITAGKHDTSSQEWEYSIYEDWLEIQPRESIDQTEIRQWLASRKEAGREIDPETAEVGWMFADTFDPYGVFPFLPEGKQPVGRENFARSPGSDVWVWFGDLPTATAKALWEKHIRIEDFEREELRRRIMNYYLSANRSVKKKTRRESVKLGQHWALWAPIAQLVILEELYNDPERDMPGEVRDRFLCLVEAILVTTPGMEGVQPDSFAEGAVDISGALGYCEEKADQWTND